MLVVTDTAVDAIKDLAPGEAGLRVLSSGLAGVGGPESFQVQVVEQPEPHDSVLDAKGAHVFLDPRAAELLDDHVLDATVEGSRVRFAVAPQP